jgi:hypothetical protein
MPPALSAWRTCYEHKQCAFAGRPTFAFGVKPYMIRAATDVQPALPTRESGDTAPKTTLIVGYRRQLSLGLLERRYVVNAAHGSHECPELFG